MKRLFYKTVCTITVACILASLFYAYPAKATEPEFKTDTTQFNRNALYKVIALEGAYTAGSMMVLQNAWYKDRKSVPFHFFNDNGGHMQVDKFGHAFGAYAESYIGYHLLKSIGAGRTNALLLGGTLGFILQMPIEIMDGIHEGWGFSWGDVTANAMGSGLVIGQELLFREQVIKYKFSYWESSYSQRANGYLGKTTLDRLLKDYNGHTYWLSMPVSKFILPNRIPPWLNIAIGYGANGMFGEFENIKEYNGQQIEETARYRQYLLSLDIDWTRIKTRSRLLKTVFKGMVFIKLPFPALELSSEGKFRGYYMYY